MEARVRRSLRVALFALSIGVVVALTAGASATPGPGGWDNLGTGSKPTSSAFVDAVYALNSDAPGVLYAGGRFIDAGGDLSADFLAQWKNGRWTRAVSVPLTASVNAIAYRAGKLYVGGVFVNAGGNPNADFLAVWDGTKWGTVCNTTGPPIGGNVSSPSRSSARRSTSAACSRTAPASPRPTTCSPATWRPAHRDRRSRRTASSAARSTR